MTLFYTQKNTILKLYFQEYITIMFIYS